MSKLTTTWWIIFYKDQLLLKKQITDFNPLCRATSDPYLSGDQHT